MKFPEPTTENAKLALDTVLQEPTKGIPTWIIHVMQHSNIERIAGVEPGAYKRNSGNVYLDCHRATHTKYSLKQMQDAVKMADCIYCLLPEMEAV